MKRLSIILAAAGVAIACLPAAAEARTCESMVVYNGNTGGLTTLSKVRPSRGDAERAPTCEVAELALRAFAEWRNDPRDTSCTDALADDETCRSSVIEEDTEAQTDFDCDTEICDDYERGGRVRFRMRDCTMHRDCPRWAEREARWLDFTMYDEPLELSDDEAELDEGA